MFIYTDLVREAIADIAATVPAFAHLDAGRIAVACAARWAGSKWGNLATCIGLADRSEPAFAIWARRRSRVVTQVSPWHRRESARIVFHGAECRYLVLLRMPRHLEHDPLDTIVHELFHIGESFDGRLRAMRHGRIFDWHVTRLAREWRAKGSPALVASLEMTLPQLLARHGAVHAHRMPGDFRSGRIVPAEAPCSYEEGLARLYPKFRFAPGGYRMGPPPKFDPPSARIHFTERDRTLRRFTASGASDLSRAAERYLARASRISFPAFVDDSLPLG